MGGGARDRGSTRALGSTREAADVDAAAALGSAAAALGSFRAAERGSAALVAAGGAAAIGATGSAALDPPSDGTAVCTISSLLIRKSIASGSCGCPDRILRASSGSPSATSFSFATTSYISAFDIPFRASATALVPALVDAPPPPDDDEFRCDCCGRSIPSFPAKASRCEELLKLTRMRRPLSSYSFIFRIALKAACGSSNSTKANPRGFPVSASVTMRTLMTLPISENAWCN
mmetsp:Transcript_41542/g.119892  ORF Transcript_41542/g.119892 Transcript_41542/m.119892 type:complete len:233 (+) Transcript_41542:284-982(+)